MSEITPTQDFYRTNEALMMARTSHCANNLHGHFPEAYQYLRELINESLGGDQNASVEISIVHLRQRFIEYGIIDPMTTHLRPSYAQHLSKSMEMGAPYRQQVFDYHAPTEQEQSTQVDAVSEQTTIGFRLTPTG